MKTFSYCSRPCSELTGQQQEKKQRNYVDVGKYALILAFGVLFSMHVGAQIIQDFGTATGSLGLNSASTSLIPAPSGATTYARLSGVGGVVLTNPGLTAFGCDSELQLQATSSTNNANFAKASPIVGATGASSQAYLKFNVIMGGANMAANQNGGSWFFYVGNGTMYSNTSDFTNSQVFTGLEFDLNSGGALGVSYRQGSNWSSFNPNMVQLREYTVELMMNNSGSTINYTYNGTSDNVPSYSYDMYVNGTRVADNFAKAGLSNGSVLSSMCWIGSASSGAYVFTDDYSFSTSIPSIISNAAVAVTTTAGATGNVLQGQSGVVLNTYNLAVTRATAVLNGLSITTTGSYQSADLTRLQLYYSTSSTFDGTATLLSTINTPGAAGVKTFSPIACQSIPSGTTGYLFVVADIPCSATTGRTIGIASGSTSFPNNTISFADGSLSGTMSASGTRTTATGTVSITTQPSSITQCEGTSATLALVATGGGTLSYQWRQGGTNVGTNSASYTMNPLSAANTGSYTCVVTNACGSVTSNSVSVVVNPLPGAAGSISGTASVCQGASNVPYLVSSVTNASSYTWTYSGSNTTISGSGSGINLNFGAAATSGNLIVTPVNACGNGTASAAYAITVNPTAGAAGSITGSATVCQGQTGVNYSVSAIANATSYTWSYSGTGATISGSGTNISINFSSNATSGNLTVQGSNGCGNGTTSANFAITVNPTPGNAGSITGSSSVCQGQSAVAYSIAEVSNATSYSWTYTGTGATVSGTGNALTISFSTTATSGNLTVAGTNGCGNGATSSVFAINVNALPAAAGNISGTATVCQGQSSVNYSVSAIANANSYTWSYSGTGATITGTGTGVTISFGATATSGNLTVMGVNSCGNGTVSANYPITVNPLPAAAGAITGTATVCAGTNNVAYSVPAIANATTYSWSYSGTGATISGTGTNVTINFSSNATSGNLTVRGSNTCGLGTVSANFPITVNTVPAGPSAMTGSSSPCQGANNVAYSISPVAGATSYTWYYLGMGVTINGSGNSITANFSNTAGNGQMVVLPQNSCGASGTFAFINVNVTPLPGAAGAISGLSTVCANTNNISYSVPAISNANTYVWSYSGTGATITGSGASVTINFATNATSGNLTVYGTNACGNGSVSAAYAITVNASPAISNMTTAICSGGTFSLTPVNGVNGTVPTGTTYTWAAPVGSGFSGGSAQASLQSAISQTLTTSGASAVTATYTITPRNGTCVGSTFTGTVTVRPVSTIAIAADYCSTGGTVILTATAGFSSYAWSTAQTTASINVNQAGTYSVTGTNSFNCPSTATQTVAQELVVNGNFSAGNTGFTTQYTNSPTNLYGEGTYGVISNPNTAHANFWGTDRSGNGNMMVVNASGAAVSVWEQSTIAVQPNTTYYFSAWAMSVNAAPPYATLQFSINGLQVGTVATLTAGPSFAGAANTWTQFYGSWNSGSATVADLAIVNLQTALGGNDFALDDISFGTLSPTALALAPSVNGNSSVCQGGNIDLQCNATGGASPFTYSWTGPNGFTSNLANPCVTTNALAATHNGTYTITITDGVGCSRTSSITVTVNPLPNALTPTAVNASVCAGNTGAIQITNSENGVFYQLANAATGAFDGIEVTGTGGTITLPTSAITATRTFNVIANRYSTGCSRVLTPTVTISVATTPVLVITNQSVCSGTVNLTAAAVTAGSTGGGTLTYWTNAAATAALSNPSSVNTAGTYFIRSAVGSCVDIEPVVVGIGNTQGAAFTYAASTYCSNGTNPAPSFTAGNVAGTFSATPAGLVFVNTFTGTINLAASAPGTYTVRNTVSPAGGCSSTTATFTVNITAYPNANFSYVSNGLCQAVGANNPMPILETGAQAGTFSSSAGLNFVNTATGEINLASSTPGNYAVVNTIAAANGCPVAADTVYIDINPYTFSGAITASTSASQLCAGQTFNAFSGGTSYLSVLESDNFNASFSGWTSFSFSTGGSPAASSFTRRANGYAGNGYTVNSNDNTQMYVSDARAQGSGTTQATLRSPYFNTIGYTSLTLEFFHWFQARNGSIADVQVSTNLGSTWTSITTYTTSVGASNSFQNATVNLNAYVGFPYLAIRFVHAGTGGNARQWAIDNVRLYGNCSNYTYAWSSSPAGYTSTAQNPTNIAPTASAFYVVTARNTYGCTIPSSPLPVTVNPLPGNNAGSNVTTCAGTGVTIGTTATAGRTYAWTPTSGLSSATVSNPTATLSNTTTYSLTETITATGCSSTNSVQVAVTPATVITTQPVAPAAVCAGSGTASLSVIAGGSALTYQWRLNGSPIANNAIYNGVSTNALTITNPTALEAGSYDVVVTGTCGTVTSTARTLTVNPIVTPSVNITANPGATICAGTSVTFTATPTNGGTTPAYQWRRNGTNISGATSATFSTSTFTNGDQITCVLTSNAACTSSATATSNTITMTVNPLVAPTVSITANPGNAICAGTSVTFSAAITNGGTTPTYQWRLNGSNISGATSATYSSSSLNNGDQITCVLTSNASCLSSTTATSSAITMSVSPLVTPTVTVSSSAGTTICSGTSVTFSTTITNGGSIPAYQWRLNGSNISGATSSTYTTNTLASGNQISCVLTSNATCLATNNINSSALTMTVNPTVTPTISISASTGANICAGTSVTFTSSITNGGSAPSYQWRLNGTNISGATSASYTSAALNNGDQISCVLTSNAACATSTTATSSAITMNVTPQATPTVMITANPGTSVCAGTSVTFTATPTNGGTTPAYQWRINGSNVTGATSASFTTASITNGQNVSCVLTSNASCISSTTATSNALTMTVNALTTPAVTIAATSATSVCAGTAIAFSATPTQAGTTPTYQWKRNNINVGTNSATYSASNFNNGDVVTCQITSSAACATASSVLSNTVAVSVTPLVTPVVSIAQSTNGALCAGSPVSFVANAMSAGSNPTYQWKRNGVNVGSNTPNFSANNLVNGDVISCSLTSTANCLSSSVANSNNVTISFAGGITYFIDLDDDGYGNPAVSINSCTPVVGYVLNNTDCDDANADRNPGTDEWYNEMDDNCDGNIDENAYSRIYYRDQDFDNYGSATDTLRSFVLPYGYALVAGDCNDNNAMVNPSRTELCNGIDDDCDNVVDEGCGPMNDNKANALVLVSQPFPGCTDNAYTLAGGTPTAGYTGEDVWFYFVPTTPGIRISVFSQVNNIDIRLSNAVGTLLDQENVVNGIGNEVLSYVGLTPGETYFVMVRNANTAQAGGAFTICASHYTTSFLNNVNATVNLCETPNTDFVAAQQYTVKFTNTVTNVVTTYNTAANSTLVVLNNVTGLAWGQTYRVVVDAVFSSMRGNGVAELVVMPGTQNVNITIAQHVNTQLRTADACPNNRLLSSTIGMQTWICGASDYQWEFTRTSPTAAAPIVVNRGQNNMYLPLSMVTGLVAGSTYNVRIRPVLPGGIVGNYGPSVCMTIGATASLEVIEEKPILQTHNEERSMKKELEEDEGLKFNIFPNPCDGRTVYLNIENMLEPSFDVRIFDQTGRYVYTQHVVANGNMQLALNLEGYIPSGVYHLELVMNNNFHLKRKLVVER